MQSGSNRRGVLASISASTLFGVIFLVPPHLSPLDPSQMFGYRIPLMIGFLALYFSLTRAWAGVRSLARRLRTAPALIVVLVVDAALMGTQNWLFGWAPATGHGLALSLGYLILPLVMVVVGVVLHGEHLTAMRLAAVACAVVGVVCAVLFGGGLGWPTLLSALGFPPYFALRRRFELDSAAAQFLELVAMSPVAIGILVVDPSWRVVAAEPTLAGWLVFLGAISAAGFALYLMAGRVLPFGLFGVLGYLEPLLLLVFSVVVLAEPLTVADAFTYAPIALALTLMGVATLSQPTGARPPHAERAGADPAEGTAGTAPRTPLRSRAARRG